MNFLGHFYLSQGDPNLIVGNYIADFVKGNKFNDYPEEISEGIKMHREIDYYTDRHYMVRRGRKRLFSTYRHYSGVIIDMFYDHYLANLWPDYSQDPLPEFADRIYGTIQRNWEHLPPGSQHMFPYMKSGNWLLRYATTDGIGRSLNGMAHRLNNNSGMEKSIYDLHKYYDEFLQEFQAFIVDIKNNFS